MSQGIRIPRSWLKRRIYFALMPQGYVPPESVNISREAAKRGAEKWSGAKWEHLAAYRWTIESVK